MFYPFDVIYYLMFSRRPFLPSDVLSVNTFTISVFYFDVLSVMSVYRNTDMDKDVNMDIDMDKDTAMNMNMNMNMDMEMNRDMEDINVD
jgi:hypothetical protein